MASKFIRSFLCGPMPAADPDLVLRGLPDPDFEKELLAWKECMGYNLTDKTIRQDTFDGAVLEFKAEIRSIVED